MSQSETYVVELTPPGRGAIAVVLVAGPDAVAAVDRSFTAANGKRLSEQSIGRIVFGRWSDGTAADGEELVVCRRDADSVEVHPHGGRASVGAVIDRLVGGDCTRVASNNRFAYEDSDPIRAAARMALADAPTERTAAILLDQYHGALRDAIESLAVALRNDGPTAATEREALLARAEIGRHLTRPWHAVLAGPPNVGKSSLVNAILGYTRAIVFDQPGTTRDVVTATTAVDGWPIEFSDTAGLREGGNTIEVAGVELTRKQLVDADLVVWVDDAQSSHHAPRDEAGRTTCVAHPKRQPLYVFNKIDLLQSSPGRSGVDTQTVLETGYPLDSLFTSATTGEGIPTLLATIASRLVPDPPPPGAAVPFTEEQIDTIRAMRLQSTPNGPLATRKV